MQLFSELTKEVQWLGFPANFTNPQEYFSWLRKVQLILRPEKLKNSPAIQGFTAKDETFSDVRDAFSGSFGVIQLSYMDSAKQKGYVYLKTSKDFHKSLLVEGLLQSAAHVALKLHGISHGTPRVYKIAQFPDVGVGLVLERIPNSRLFAEYLEKNFRWNQPCAENDSLVLQIIAQVATSMAILEHDLGMNHRDLKGTNVLMVAPVEPYMKVFNVGPHGWKLVSNLQVSIIDFGFTCIGAAGKTVVSAGEFMPETDFCPKQGRDLFLFFASLWNIPQFRQSVSASLAKQFNFWLLDSEQKSWATWLESNSDSTLMSMYLLCSGSTFTAPPCTPIRVLQDVQKLAPDVVQYALLRRPGTPIPEI